MRRPFAVWLLLAGIAAAGPAVAGTVYLPVIALDEPGGAAYRTRIWLTAAGAGGAQVEVLFLPELSDGTRNRAQPETLSVPAGATTVLFPELGTGLLEIQAPADVAIGAELRSSALKGPEEVFGPLPVVGSAEASKAGGTLVLQGMRRTTAGVRTHLGLMNLGHRQASCDVEVVAADGRRLAKVSKIPVPALSHVLFRDALGLLGLVQIGDVHTRISCNRRFYSYAALVKRDTGEAVFVRPSPTGESAFAPPGATEPEPEDDPPAETPPPSGGKSTVFNVSGHFHTPTAKNPMKVFNIDVPKNRTYRRVLLDLDVTPGDWSYEPSKMHSIFWLHRGGCCWPKWHENILGFVNAHGPGKNQVRVEHNLDYPPKVLAFGSALGLEKGKTYHFRFEYDAAGGEIRLKVTHGGQVLKQMVNPATTGVIRPPASGKFMAYFGHEDNSAHGPERPTYGWKYSNLRVEFVP